MKSTETFKSAIENHLKNRALEDELFAVTLKKENKNIDECINYILKTVKDSGCNGFADEEIFGMAVHYYDEDDIKNVASVSGRVIINKSIELTEEEKAVAKQKGIDLAIEEAKAEAKKKLSETIELNDDDLADAKKIAIEKVVTEQKEKMVKKKSPKKVEASTEVEPDLFS